MEEIGKASQILDHTAGEIGALLVPKAPALASGSPANTSRSRERRSFHSESKERSTTMNWIPKLQFTSIHESTTEPALNGPTAAILQEYWPRIQLLFVEKVGPAALAAAQNDQTMASLFRGVYSMLPFPVRMVVNEGAFVNFCLNNRTRLLPQSGMPPSTH
jgi:hypothetical protein